MKIKAVITEATGWLLLGTIVWTACWLRTPTEPGPELAGTYQLQTIAGHNIPDTLFKSDSGRYIIPAAHITLHSDDTFVDILVRRVEPTGQPPVVFYDTLQGSWQLNQSTVDFIIDFGQGVYVAQWDPKSQTLRESWSTGTWSYRKK